MELKKKVLVTGAGGYVGSMLTPKLLDAGFQVLAFDTYWYGQRVFETYVNHRNLTIIKGDIRDILLLKEVMQGVWAVIHLACISNDPSFDLNPDLGKSINLDAFEPLVKTSSDLGVERFIYASSSSVYGVKEEDEVTEELSLEPMTDYSRFKMICEDILLSYGSDNFVPTILRPATVCGYSARQRLDLSVNILTLHALTKRSITVFGGSQQRPNIHIKDMVGAYLCVLNGKISEIKNEIYNVGTENLSINDIANLVSLKTKVMNIERFATDDLRSYRVNSNKFIKRFNFIFKNSVSDAVDELIFAFKDGRLKNPSENPLYYNIRRMKELGLG